MYIAKCKNNFCLQILNDHTFNVFFSIQISMNVQVTHATTMALVITISENGIALVQLVGPSLTVVQVRYLILKLVEE